MPSLSRKLFTFGAVVAFWLAALPAFSQERLLVFREGGSGSVLAEVDTSDSSLGTIRNVLRLPFDCTFCQWHVIPVSGGRYFILQYRYSPFGPTMIGVFDTRSFTAFQWLTFPGGVKLEADDFRPRIFYRTTQQLGVIEAPSFVPRVLHQGFFGFVDDVLVSQSHLEYAQATDTLFLVENWLTDFHIAGFDVQTGVRRVTVRLVAELGVTSLTSLLVDNAGRRLILTPAVGGDDSEVRATDCNFARLKPCAGRTRGVWLSASSDPLHP